MNDEEFLNDIEQRFNSNQREYTDAETQRIFDLVGFGDHPPVVRLSHVRVHANEYVAFIRAQLVKHATDRLLGRAPAS